MCFISFFADFVGLTEQFLKNIQKLAAIVNSGLSLLTQREKNNGLLVFREIVTEFFTVLDFCIETFSKVHEIVGCFEIVLTKDTGSEPYRLRENGQVQLSHLRSLLDFSKNSDCREFGQM